MPVSKSEKLTVSVKFAPAEIAVIDRAAALRGCTRAEFVTQAAREAATCEATDPRSHFMSPESHTGFLEVIDRPAEAVPQIVEIFTRPAPWEHGRKSGV